MFKRCVARPPLYCRAPIQTQRILLRHKSNLSKPISKPANPKSSNYNNDSSSNNKKSPESWARFIAVRVVAISVGYTIGKVYYYYNPKETSTSFISYELLSRDPISSSLSIFTIRPHPKNASNPPSNASEITASWNSAIWNLEFKQPQLQITRAYTPIPLGDDVEKTNQLQFLIRRDPRGEVSNYLHRLPPGAEIQMRGPNIEYPLPRNTKNVIFIAGGTGIAPALQVAHAMFQSSSLDPSETQEKQLHILWANRADEDITYNTTHPNPIINHLEELRAKYEGNVKVSYFVDQRKQFVTPAVVSSALERVTSSASSNRTPPSTFTNTNTTDPDTDPETQIIISGPEGFISYLAGPKLWKDGIEQQGPLGGILAGVLAERERTNRGGNGERGRVKVWKV